MTRSEIIDALMCLLGNCDLDHYDRCRFQVCLNFAMIAPEEKDVQELCLSRCPEIKPQKGKEE